MPVQATIGNQFDLVFAQQQVNQHTIVVFGIPYPQTTEHGSGALAYQLWQRYPVAKMAPQVGHW